MVDQQSVQTIVPQKITSQISQETNASVDPEKAAITFQLQQAVADLTQTLLDKHPSMPTLLRQIHRTIKQYPEQVTILPPEELNHIVEAQKHIMNVQLGSSSTAASSATKSLKSKIKNLGAAAF